jgi:signal transduction histidine kinase
LITESMFADFDHALRGPLTVILGETELVLSQADVSPDERRRSAENLIQAVREMENLLVQWRGAAAGPPQGSRQR